MMMMTHTYTRGSAFNKSGISYTILIMVQFKIPQFSFNPPFVDSPFLGTIENVNTNI